jgi:hypothetical protein
VALLQPAGEHASGPPWAAQPGQAVRPPRAAGECSRVLEGAEGPGPRRGRGREQQSGSIRPAPPCSATHHPVQRQPTAAVVPQPISTPCPATVELGHRRPGHAPADLQPSTCTSTTHLSPTSPCPPSTSLQHPLSLRCSLQPAVRHPPFPIPRPPAVPWCSLFRRCTG